MSKSTSDWSFLVNLVSAKCLMVCMRWEANLMSSFSKVSVFSGSLKGFGCSAVMLCVFIICSCFLANS